MMASFTATSTTPPSTTRGASAAMSRKIEAHADGDQEHAEQQAFERVDGDLDLAAEFGLGQQQAGDQRAEFHRQADHRGGKPGREDHQQAGGDEQFRAAGARDAAEQRPQHQAAGDDQPEHDNDRLDDRPGERHRRRRRIR